MKPILFETGSKDVCEILGYGQASVAVNRHCKYAKLLKVNETVSLEIPPRGLLIIPESDLYRLILRSNIPDAEAFQSWVTEEVLPRIRKTGGYVMGEEAMSESEGSVSSNSNTTNAGFLNPSRCGANDGKVGGVVPRYLISCLPKSCWILANDN